MPRQKKKRPEPTTRSRPSSSSTSPDAGHAGGFRPATLLAWLAGSALGRFTNFYAAIFVGMAGVVLSFAWTMGPQQFLDEKRNAKLTARADARIVDRWLAIEWKPRDERKAPDWRNAAKATACAVVEYDGDWGSQRRAFCGTRFLFRVGYEVTHLAKLAPDVPFDWARDASGLALPELRMASATKAYLERAAPQVPPFPHTVTARNALELLQFELVSPTGSAIRGWSAPDAVIRLAVDPADPATALPAGFVERPRRFDDWGLGALICGAFGLVFWWAGMSMLLYRIPLLPRILMAALPLAALPWWGEHLPRAVARLNEDFGEVIEDMLGDVDRLGRLVATEPGDALLADGERIAWKPGGYPYEESFGQLTLAGPAQPLASPDAALAALNERVAAQVRGWPEDKRESVFRALESEKKRSLYGAGYAFLPAAAEALRDPRASDATRLAARAFLTEWVTQPLDEPWPGQVAFAGRVALYRDLQKVPVNVIANLAELTAERSEKRAAEKK